MKWWSEQGKQDKLIYRYKLTRRPGQAPLLSKSLAFGGVEAPQGDVAALRAATVPVLALPLSLASIKRLTGPVNRCLELITPFLALPPRTA